MKKTRYKIFSLIAAFVVLFSSLTGAFLSNKAKADSKEISVIESIELTNHPGRTDPPYQNAPASNLYIAIIKMNFPHNAKKGDTFKFRYPESIDYEKVVFDHDILDENGIVVAKSTYLDENTIEFELTDYFDTHENVKATYQRRISADTVKVTKSGTYKFNFIENPETSIEKNFEIEKTIKFYTPPDVYTSTVTHENKNKSSCFIVVRTMGSSFDSAYGFFRVKGSMKIGDITESKLYELTSFDSYGVKIIKEADGATFNIKNVEGKGADKTKRPDNFKENPGYTDKIFEEATHDYTISNIKPGINYGLYIPLEYTRETETSDLIVTTIKSDGNGMTNDKGLLIIPPKSIVTANTKEVEEVLSRISLQKNADKSKYKYSGELINYNFIITNTGDEDLKNIVLTDDMLGGEITLDKTELKIGESMEVTKEYEIKDLDLNLEELNNTADVKGIGVESEKEVTDTANVVIKPEIDEPEYNPQIKLVKSADKAVYKEVDEDVFYTLTITNTGDEALKDIVLIDDMFGGKLELEKTELEVGESTEVLKAYKIVEEDLDKENITNTALVKGVGVNSGKNVDDTAVVIIKPEAEKFVPMIKLEKSVNKKVVSEEGEKLIYSFMITNTGEEKLTNIKLIDEMLGGDIKLNETELDVGKSMKVDAEYTVTKLDIENKLIENTANVVGIGAISKEEVKDTDKEDVAVYIPKISLTKTVDKKVVKKIGEEVIYTLVIKNTGDEPLKEVKLNDPMLGGDLKLNKTELAVGEEIELKVKHKITKDEYAKKEIKNTAKAEAVGQYSNRLVEDDASAVVKTEKPKIPNTGTVFTGNKMVLGLSFIAMIGGLVAIRKRTKNN